MSPRGDCHCATKYDPTRPIRLLHALARKSDSSLQTSLRGLDALSTPSTSLKNVSIGLQWVSLEGLDNCFHELAD